MSVQRISSFRAAMIKDGLDSFFVNHLDHIRYLTGFTGSAGILIVNRKGADFFTDFRYKSQAGKQVTGAKVHIVAGDSIAGLKNFANLNPRYGRLGVSQDHMTLAMQDRLRQSLNQAVLLPSGHLTAELGWVKEKSEIDNIVKAAGIADASFMAVLPMIQPGTREMEVRAELEYQMMARGSEKPAFETIIASGFRSALPHGVASEKKIAKGDFVTLDFGATVGGYVCDITRTVVVGKASPKHKRIYALVLKAQMASIKKVMAGIPAKDVDSAGRDIITRAGFGDKFGHGTGHGIGFYIHVGPNVSQASKHILKPNNVITIEPGVYLEGWGGVRIEDDVVVTSNGGKVLNKAPKNLLEL
jgi:Xaa-Pro aminopeptidase